LKVDITALKQQLRKAGIIPIVELKDRPAIEPGEEISETTSASSSGKYEELIGSGPSSGVKRSSIAM
jgi:hypothetical protein